MTGAVPPPTVADALAGLDEEALAALADIAGVERSEGAPPPRGVGPFAAALAETPTLRDAAFADHRTTRIVVGLYGGVRTYDHGKLSARRDRLRRCLEDDGRPWDERLAAARELDAVVEPRLREASEPGLELRPEHVVDRSELTPLLVRMLTGGASPEEVLEALWTVAGDPTRTAEARSDALAALALAGDDPLPAWRAVLGNLGDAEPEVRDGLRRRLRRARKLADDALPRVDGDHAFRKLTLGADARAAAATVVVDGRRGDSPGNAVGTVLLAAEAAERDDRGEVADDVRVRSFDEAARHVRALAAAPELTATALVDRLVPLVALGGAGMAITLDTMGARLREDPAVVVEALAELPFGGRRRLLAEHGLAVGPGLDRVAPVPVRALTVLHAWVGAAADLVAGLLAVVGPHLAAGGHGAHVVGLLVDTRDDRAERIAQAVTAAAPEVERPLLERLWSLRSGGTRYDCNSLSAELFDSTGLSETGYLQRFGDGRRCFVGPMQPGCGEPATVATSVEVCLWGDVAEGARKDATKLFRAIAEGPAEQWRELQLLRLLEHTVTPLHARHRTQLVERIGELESVTHRELRRLAPLSAVPPEVRLEWAVVVLATRSREALRALDGDDTDPGAVDPPGEGAEAVATEPAQLTLRVDAADRSPVEIVVTDASPRHPRLSIAAQEELLRERDLDIDPGLAAALEAAARAAVAAQVDLSTLLAAVATR